MAVAIEGAAITFGYPYGHFMYDAKAGFMIGNLVPWTTPFAWLTILLGSLALTEKYTATRGQKIILTAVIMVLIDVLLDPVAVSLGLWHWIKPGLYYGVPLINYCGWIISSLLGSYVLYTSIHTISSPNKPSPHSLAIGLYFSLIFWLGIAFFKQLYIPGVFGVLFVLYYRKQLNLTVQEIVYA